MAKKVPKTDDQEAEAVFWDSTSIDELAPGELMPAHVSRPKRPLSTTFAIRFDAETVAAIRSAADAEGIGATQLARRWVLERLRIERRVGTLTAADRSRPTAMELAIRNAVVAEILEQLPDFAERALQRVRDQAG